MFIPSGWNGFKYMLYNKLNMRITGLILMCLPAFLWGQRYQLAAPGINADSVFFFKSTNVQLEFDLDSATILYTTDGALPIGNAPVYKKPFTLTETTTLRAKAVHPEFLPSLFVEKQVFKVPLRPDSVYLQTTPDSAYAGKGAATLFDLQKGEKDLHSGRWLGFKGDTIVLELFFKEPIMSKRLIFSTLFDAGAWVFPPAAVEVLGAETGKDWRPMGVWSARSDTSWKERPARYELFERVVLRPVAVERLRIRIIPFGRLPEGHPGAGRPAWLFLDEIFFQ